MRACVRSSRRRPSPPFSRAWRSRTSSTRFRRCVPSARACVPRDRCFTLTSSRCLQLLKQLEDRDDLESQLNFAVRSDQVVFFLLLFAFLCYIVSLTVLLSQQAHAHVLDQLKNSLNAAQERERQVWLCTFATIANARGLQLRREHLGELEDLQSRLLAEKTRVVGDLRARIAELEDENNRLLENEVIACSLAG